MNTPALQKIRLILATIVENPKSGYVAQMELGRLWEDAFGLGGKPAQEIADRISEHLAYNHLPDRRALKESSLTTEAAAFLDSLTEVENPDFLPARCLELIEETQWEIMEKTAALIQDSRGRVVDTDEFISQTHSSIARANASKLKITSASQAADINWQNFTHRRAHPNELLGIPTGFSSIDRATQGLQYGKPYVLGARPSHGKTAIAGNIADHAASLGIPVMIFAHEMTAEDHSLRLAAARAGIDYNHVLTGSLTLKCTDRLRAALDQIQKLPLWVCDDSAATPQQCQAAAYAMQARHGRGLIIIDYIQLERIPGWKSTRTDELAHISSSWLTTTKRTRHALLMLAQLNRSAAGQAPKLHELKDCGAIEQDAHSAMLLWRPGMDSEDKPANQGSLFLAKNRNGPLALNLLHFTGFCMQFRDWQAGDTERTRSEQERHEQITTAEQKATPQEELPQQQQQQENF